jgi:hypothetical protein
MFSRTSFWLKVQGGTIYAVATACLGRSVVEHMPQMSVALRANNLGSLHAVRIVGGLRDDLVVGRLVERRPPAMRREFRGGRE